MAKFVTIGERIHCISPAIKEAFATRNPEAILKRAKEQLDISLTIRDSVKKHIVETGTDQKYGARPLRRAVQNQLEDKLAEAVLTGEVLRGTEVVAGMSKKEIKFMPKTTK